MGIAAITDHLNAKGHRTRDGNLFGVGTVHEVLTHANSDTGLRPWNVHSKTGRENKPEAVIEIPVPMIVPREQVRSRAGTSDFAPAGLSRPSS